MNGADLSVDAGTVGPYWKRDMDEWQELLHVFFYKTTYTKLKTTR